MNLKELFALDPQTPIAFFSSYTDRVEQHTVESAIKSYLTIEREISAKDARIWLADCKVGTVATHRILDAIEDQDSDVLKGYSADEIKQALEFQEVR